MEPHLCNRDSRTQPPTIFLLTDWGHAGDSSVRGEVLHRASPINLNHREAEAADFRDFQTVRGKRDTEGLCPSPTLGLGGLEDLWPSALGPGVCTEALISLGANLSPRGLGKGSLLQVSRCQ